ncbi:MAG: hypothetical protein ACREA0_02115 [bacterium]
MKTLTLARIGAIRTAAAIVGTFLIGAATQGLAGPDPGLPVLVKPASPVGTNYRVLSYNVQLRPVSIEADFDQTADGGKYNMSNEVRAGHIADAILRGKYDIIALNEVFHGGARSVLLDRLRPHFPTVVEFLSAGNVNLLEDSGLMFFSKFGSIPVSTPPGGECSIESGVDGFCRVAFHMYSDGAGDDALAQKGIGFIRLNNPSTGRPVNVFFTHMQATRSGTSFAADSGTRVTQIAEAKDFIEGWAPLGATGQDALLMGDMNIIGPPNATASTDEYTDHLVSASGFGGLGFGESYDFGSLGADPMLTFDGPRNIAGGDSEERLDYLFLRPAAGTASCIEHQRVRRDARVEFGSGADYVNIDLSDHYGLDVEIGPATAQCGPQDAKLIVADGDYAQRIERPRALQWFKFAEPGTYSFQLDISDSAMKVEAFRASDLSTALSPYEGNVAQNTLFTFSIGPPRVVYAVDEPFFVRVSAVSPDFTGDYTLRSHRHTGASFDDAIALDPFTTLHQAQMSTPTAASLSKVHYSLVQRRLYSGAKQRLAFDTANHQGLQLRLGLFNAARQPLSTPAGPCTSNPLVPGSVQCVSVPIATGYQADQQELVVEPSSSPISGEKQRLYLTVDREGCGGPCFDDYDIHWTSDYRQLDVREVFARDTGDTTGAARILMYVRIDGGPFLEVDLGDFGSNRTGKGVPAVVREIGFTDSVRISFVDVDNFSADDVSAPQTFAATDIRTSDDRLLSKTLQFPILRGGQGAQIGLYEVPVVGRALVHN